MLKSNRQMQSYSDGWAEVFPRPVSQTSFGAVDVDRSVDPASLIVRVAYTLCANRDQDYEFAERAGFELSLKLRALRRERVEAGCRAVIRGTLFDVSHVDYTRTEMYLYLQEVGPVAA